MSDSAVIITGALGGIGAALCDAFERAGYFVVSTDVLDAKHESESRYYIQCDLSRLADEDNYAAEFASIVRTKLKARNKKLRVLINNAAIQILGSTSEVTREDWCKTISVNVTAPLFLVKSFLPELEETKGLVLNISSIHSRLTKKNFLSYAVSKSALTALTRALSVDLGNSVRVNSIEPAAIETSMLVAGFENNPDGLSDLAGFHPQQRIGKPEEVANLAVLMASPKIDFLHGASISMDGGISNRLFDPS